MAEDRKKIPRLVVGYYINDGTKNRFALRGRITSDFSYEVNPPFSQNEMSRIMFAAKQEAFKILRKRKIADNA